MVLVGMTTTHVMCKHSLFIFQTHPTQPLFNKLFVNNLVCLNMLGPRVAYNLVFIIHFAVNLDAVVSDVMLSADNIALNGCLGCIYPGVNELCFHF